MPREHLLYLVSTVTDTPTNVKSEMTGDYTVQLSWSVPASNIPPVVGYEVFYAVSGSDVTQSGGTTTNSTSISVTLPSISATYDFFVVAFSDADNTLTSARSSNSTIYLSGLPTYLYFLKGYAKISCKGFLECSCMTVSNQMAFLC